MSRIFSEEALRITFHRNPTVNPRTGRKITPTGKVYKELVKEFGAPPTPVVSTYQNIPVGKELSASFSKVSLATPVQEKKEEVESDPHDLRQLLELSSIDPFDHVKYQDDYCLFNQYFTDIELYLRLASWLLYKYAYLNSESARYKLMLEVKKSLNQKATLESLSESFDNDGMLAYWYLHFNPAKATIQHITEIRARYHTNEDYLFNRLYRTYVDKEHRDRPLWFGDFKPLAAKM